jgi:coenzyme PQQ synthesis protein D (PqqD)
LAKSTTISLDSIDSVAADQVSCDLNGEPAILDHATGTYFGLDSIGAMVWSLLADPIAVHEIVDAIVADYDVKGACCKQDLLTLLARLDQRSLIQSGNGNGR